MTPEVLVAFPPKRDGDPGCGVFPGKGGDSESVVEAGVALRRRGVEESGSIGVKR